MEKRAIIYTRVSTDEQADKGYSLAFQEERLRKYCETQSTSVIAHFQDDHSAKSFNRPQFNELLKYCKSNKNRIDTLLFLNWSRFSRNTKDSYVMMDVFLKLGIELRAIDQPLDLSIPENKMMLAFYVTANEVENDRRSMNVLMGMYRASKEGRWTSLAPLGYKNIREPDGRALIIPDLKNAHLVKEAFIEFSKGLYKIEELRKILFRKGLKCARSRFPLLLRNRVYMGKVFVPAYKDAPAHYVTGVHEPLISEEQFETVQNILDGKAPKRPLKNTIHDEFPLRGYLKCGVCGKNISASTSKGNGGKYYYYHCTCGCRERFKAKDTNEKFVHLLANLKIKPEAVKLFKELLTAKFKWDNQNDQLELRKTDAELTRNNSRIESAQQLLLDSEITPAEYRNIVAKYEKANHSLESLKETLRSENDLKQCVEREVFLLEKPNEYYSQSDLSIKRQLIGSLFSNKLIYINEKFETAELCEGLKLIHK